MKYFIAVIIVWSFSTNRCEADTVHVDIEVADKNAWAENNCEKPKDSGHQCDSTRDGAREQVRWYFDPEKFACLAFLYKGCGGNSNSFPTKSRCEIRCKPQDGPTCSANVKAYDFGNGTVLHARNCLELSCPQEWTCRMGLFAVCCNKTVEELYDEAYSKKCRNGGMAYMIPGQNYNESYFAETCEDLRCPPGYTCQKMHLGFAKCCSNSVNSQYTAAYSVEDNKERPDERLCDSSIRAEWKICIRNSNFTPFDFSMTTDVSSLAARKEAKNPFILNQTCISYFEYASCLDKISKKQSIQQIDQCMRVYHQAEMSTTFGFACQPRVLGIIERNFDCMAEIATEIREGKLCRGIFSNLSTTATRLENFQELCDDLNDGLRCLAPTMNRKCGAEIHDLMWEFTDLITQALYGKPCLNLTTTQDRLASNYPIQSQPEVNSVIEELGVQCSDEQQIAIYKCMIDFTKSPGATVVFGGFDASVRLVLTEDDVQYFKKMCDEYEEYNVCVTRCIQGRCNHLPYSSVPKLADPLCEWVNTPNWEKDSNCLANAYKQKEVVECAKITKQGGPFSMTEVKELNCVQYRRAFFACGYSKLASFCNASAIETYMIAYNNAGAC